ncbi:MAG: flagellar assembly protein FliW [Deltaproteobacteria bacterium]|nr:flagellar assembly protein FliW [Deltaproteobacteria bacterium]
MRVESKKFDAVLEVDDSEVIQIPHGLIGFAGETEFVLFERDQSPRIGWLQSVHDPALTLPVVSGSDLEQGYPDVPLSDAIYADRLGSCDDHEVMVVLTCQFGMVPTVNMVSPIVVDVRRRVGAQVILRGTRFASREVLSLRPERWSGAPAAAKGVAP